jgi:hypothetical protein
MDRMTMVPEIHLLIVTIVSPLWFSTPGAKGKNPQRHTISPGWKSQAVNTTGVGLRYFEFPAVIPQSI